MRLRPGTRLLPTMIPWAIVIGWAASALRGAELADVVEKVEPSVVRIDTNRAIGSGVVVNAKGWVITNYHVIDGSREAKVKFKNGRVAKVAGYVAIDPTHDLALLQLDKTSAKLLPIPIAGKLPRKGERVAAFGNPHGLSFSTSEGIISAIRRGTEVSRILGAPAYQALGYSTSATWIQTTAAISGGNSGGPLTDMEGSLVGLNTWSEVDGQNLNFAIGAPDIKRLIDGAPKDSTQPLTTLPRKPDLSTPGQIRFEMPSGRVFTVEPFIAADPTDEISAPGERFFAVPYPSGAPHLMAEYRGGVLHGALIVVSDTGQPILEAHYSNGHHQGVLRSWDKLGAPSVFLQYSKGKPHGFGLLFDDGHLRMIVEYEHDAIKGVQLMEELTLGRAFASADEAEKDEPAKQLLSQLADHLAQIKLTEGDAKKALAAAHKQQRSRESSDKSRAKSPSSDE